MHLVFLIYTDGNKYPEPAQTPDLKPCEPRHHLIHYQFGTMQRSVSMNYSLLLYLREIIDLQLPANSMNVFLTESVALHI